MSKAKLTRQELGWLLTQQAQGAAERLRSGVQFLRTQPPGASSAEGLDDSLAALDDAMRMLSGLHTSNSKSIQRRGRIDLAMLLYEVAPDARVSLAPGSGTEVFGEEAELRRMMQLLVAHGQGAEGAISVRREGDFVKIAVALGPDSSSTAATERAWLARMATRHGGRLELEGGEETVSLPADNANDVREREALHRELDEARRQGEVYARELADVVAAHDVAVSPSTIPPPLAPGEAHARFTAISRLCAGIAAELRVVMSPAVRELATSSSTSLSSAVRGSILRTQELSALLAAVGSIDSNAPSGPADLGEVARLRASSFAARAARQGIAVDAPLLADPSRVRADPRALELLIDLLVTHAISASPRESRVTLAVEASDRGIALHVDDAGPSLPATARRAFVALELEPGTYGRPTNLAVFAAAELAAILGASFSLADAPSGGLRATVAFAP